MSLSLHILPWAQISFFHFSRPAHCTVVALVSPTGTKTWESLRAGQSDRRRGEKGCKRWLDSLLDPPHRGKMQHLECTTARVLSACNSARKCLLDWTCLAMCRFITFSKLFLSCLHSDLKLLTILSSEKLAKNLSLCKDVFHGKLGLVNFCTELGW